MPAPSQDVRAAAGLRNMVREAYGPRRGSMLLRPANERTVGMRFKVFCAPGDHRDDFEVVESQLNAWSAEENPEVIDVRASVTPMADPQNKGRYLLTVLVTYRPSGG